MKTSVLIKAYNHRRFILQAIDSAVMQEVDSDFEVVIGEDFSTDGTEAAIMEWRRNSPLAINVVRARENIGAARNLVRSLRVCRGEYIALLDGDDYWTSTAKLEKQIRFLDNHPECVMCFHNAAIHQEIQSKFPQHYYLSDGDDIKTIEDLLVRNFIPTSSVMFRRGLFDEFPEWFFTLGMADWPFHILNAQHGKIGYLNEVLGVYRIHPKGYWSGRGRIQQISDIIRMYHALFAHLAPDHESVIRGMVAEHCTVLAEQLGLKVPETLSVPESLDKALIELAPMLDEILRPGWKSHMLSRAYISSAFSSHERRVSPKVRHSLVRAVQLDRSWLRNSGAWSIGAEAFLGIRTARILRRLVRVLRIWRISTS